MGIGDLNMIFLIFFFFMASIAINVNTALHLLLTAELLWITLYAASLIMGLVFNNLNILSLTFFFLILSAVEFGLGLILMLVQNIFLRSLSLSDNNQNSFKLSTRFLNKTNLGSSKLFV